MTGSSYIGTLQYASFNLKHENDDIKFINRIKKYVPFTAGVIDLKCALYVHVSYKLLKCM
jgi:hypothetical protein